MDEFGWSDAIYIGGIVLTAGITFVSTRYKLKEYIRDKTEILRDRIHQTEVELEKLHSKDELQQQIIDQFQKQVIDRLPEIYAILKSKTNGKSK